MLYLNVIIKCNFLFAVKLTICGETYYLWWNLLFVVKLIICGETYYLWWNLLFVVKYKRTRGICSLLMSLFNFVILSSNVCLSPFLSAEFVKRLQERL